MKRCIAPLLSTVLLGTACDIVPTEPPIFETRFVVPAESTTISINQLLPSSIGVSGSTFQLTIAPQGIPPRSLASMCGAACAPFPTLFVAPKPAFVDSISVTVPLPADVASAAVAGGSVAVALRHTFDFDPLRPPGGANGSITIRVVNGTSVMGSATITRPFPRGPDLVEDIPLQAGTVNGPLQVVVVLNSPAGSPTQPVTINKNATLSGTVTPGVVSVSSASVRVLNDTVSVQSVAIDLTGFEDVSERVRSGALIVDIDNPFAISGMLRLTLTGGASGPIEKQLNAAQTDPQRIEFTEAELQSLLGHDITLAVEGPVSGSAAGNFVTIAPDQRITISTQLDLIFALGAGEDES